MNNNDDTIQFFNERAQNWDEICFHEADKLNEILRICDIKKSERILDAGCGTGVFTKKLIETQADCTVGIDLSDKMIEIAKSNFMDDRASFIAEDFYDFFSEQYDCIIIYSHILIVVLNLQLCRWFGKSFSVENDKKTPKFKI